MYTILEGLVGSRVRIYTVAPTVYVEGLLTYLSSEEDNYLVVADNDTETPTYVSVSHVVAVTERR